MMESSPGTRKLAREAKAIVALAFRNGPIEDVHAGKACPTCAAGSGYSRISDAEMKLIMTSAVDRVFSLLLLRETDPEAYDRQLAFGARSSIGWDDPAGSQ